MITTKRYPLEPGTLFHFGKCNKKWRILEIDRENNTMLVIMEGFVGELAYHNANIAVKWADSSLRLLLNTAYYDKLFDLEHKKAIVASNNAGVIDNVFILSLGELNRYMPKANNRKINNSLWSWWLRTDNKNYYSKDIDEDGKVDGSGTYITCELGVRPAIRLSLNAPAIAAMIDDNNQIMVPDQYVYNGTLYAVEHNKDIVLDDSIIEIADYALTNDEIENVTIPASVKKVGYAIFGNKNVVNIYFVQLGQFRFYPYTNYGTYYNKNISEIEYERRMLNKIVNGEEIAFSFLDTNSYKEDWNVVELYKCGFEGARQYLKKYAYDYCSSLVRAKDIDRLKEWISFDLIGNKSLNKLIKEALNYCYNEIALELLYYKACKVKLSLDFIDDYLELAENKLNIKSFLIDYKNSHYTRAQISNREQAIMEMKLGIREMTLAYIKREFKYKIVGDKVKILAYKGKEAIVEVPERIEGRIVDEIGQEAFSPYRRKLGKVNCMFYNALRMVKLPDTIKIIGRNAFWGCNELSDINVPCDVDLKGTDAFVLCEGLADEKGFIIINNCFFGYTSKVTKLIIPDSVTSIANIYYSELKRKGMLASITIPESVNHISKEAFGYIFSRNITIYVKENSYAMHYCIENKLQFEVV